MATAEKARETVAADEVERIIAERVEAALAERTAKLDELIAARLASFKPDATSDLADKGMMQALADAIYSVSNNDPDAHRRRVPPEVMAKRLRAREAMEQLILETVERGQRGECQQPLYKLTRECYLGNQMIQPFWVDRATRTTKPTEVGWWGVPNEYMHPANPEAEAIHALFLESIDSVRKVAHGMRITPGGLTVRSGGLNPDGGRDSAPRVGRDIHEPSLAGRNGDRPEVHTHILGTLLPPARQMV